MGYHLASLVLTLAEPARSDYVEMMIHHLATLYLVFGAYFNNNLEIATTITFLHSIADITTGVVKFSAETVYLGFATVIFVIHIFIWAWTRNYFLPIIVWMVYDGGVPALDAHSPFITSFFAYLLSILVVLQYYWLFMFI